jgi:hypothetical protein
MRICSHWNDITLDSKRFVPRLRHSVFHLWLIWFSLTLPGTQEIVNVLRTTGDIARVLPLNASRSVVARGSADPPQ